MNLNRGDLSLARAADNDVSGSWSPGRLQGASLILVWWVDSGEDFQSQCGFFRSNLFSPVILNRSSIRAYSIPPFLQSYTHIWRMG
jgi:hypothetical protein